MATTAMVVELLIIGLEATIWCGLLLATLFGLDRLQVADLPKWPGAIFLLASAYVLGILVDRVANWLFKNAMRWWSKKRRDMRIPGWVSKWSRLPVIAPLRRVFSRLFRRGSQATDEPIEDWTRERVIVLLYTKSSTEFLNFLRTKVRIARGSAINFVLTGLSAAAFGFTRTSAQDHLDDAVRLIVLAITLMALGVLSWWVMKRIDHGYKRDLALAYHVARIENDAVYRDALKALDSDDTRSPREPRVASQEM